MDEAELQRRWEGLLFAVRRSSRYHQRRRGFFDRLDRTSNVASMVFGSAAFVGVLQGDDLKKLALWASAGLAVLAAVNLVMGSAVRARDHSDFMRKYNELEQRMLQPASEELLLSITADRLSIEANEPPVLRVLDCICHNDQLRAEGGDAGEYVTIGPLQRLFSPFFDFCDGSLKKVKDEVNT
ncbi:MULTISPECIES: hypothetical protein [unclassified Pseudomonas]|uniref:hypothetical protein n=1 Tax=unclassified Pseudomonas TaxID=196821 RepID=UPI000CD07794|nr:MULTISPECIES: hypothetical protein [unclassified Pseudomonas]POA25649.1 hypothetical protein C1895_09500 [Pseudomonas sp. FW305-3-2-15-E-TSA4]POA45044.1 hypothetical protein C1894_03470 [Pseudomonas sp. FW305-3-2-15-E-TSA2]